MQCGSSACRRFSLALDCEVNHLEISPLIGHSDRVPSRCKSDVMIFAPIPLRLLDEIIGFVKHGLGCSCQNRNDVARGLKDVEPNTARHGNAPQPVGLLRRKW